VKGANEIKNQTMFKQMDFTGYKQTLGAAGTGLVALFAGTSLTGDLQVVVLILSIIAGFGFAVKIWIEVIASWVKLRIQRQKAKENENN